MTTASTIATKAPREKHVATGILLLAWFLTIAWMSHSGKFIPDSGQAPLLLLETGTIALLAFVAAYNISAGFRHYVLHLDMRLHTLARLARIIIYLQMRHRYTNQILVEV